MAAKPKKKTNKKPQKTTTGKKTASSRSPRKVGGQKSRGRCA